MEVIIELKEKKFSESSKIYSQMLLCTKKMWKFVEGWTLRKQIYKEQIIRL